MVPSWAIGGTVPTVHADVVSGNGAGPDIPKLLRRGHHVHVGLPLSVRTVTRLAVAGSSTTVTSGSNSSATGPFWRSAGTVASAEWSGAARHG